MDALELLRRGYRAFGLGADSDVLAMFEQDGAQPAHWVVRDVTGSGREYPCQGAAALDLVGPLPERWELVGVDTMDWQVDERKCRQRRSCRVVVTGRLRMRPRGAWNQLTVPFAHVWTLAGGHVDAVFSYFDGIELRRVAEAG